MRAETHTHKKLASLSITKMCISSILDAHSSFCWKPQPMWVQCMYVCASAVKKQWTHIFLTCSHVCSPYIPVSAIMQKRKLCCQQSLHRIFFSKRWNSVPFFYVVVLNLPLTLFVACVCVCVCLVNVFFRHLTAQEQNSSQTSGRRKNILSTVHVPTH